MRTLPAQGVGMRFETRPENTLADVRASTRPEARTEMRSLAE
jgi:hypothetical protein